VPPCGIACIQIALGQVAANQIQFQSFVPQSQFLSKQFTFNQLANNDSLMHQGTFTDAVLQHFYDSVQFASIGQLHKVNELTGSGNISQAVSINGSIAPACTMEQNHKTFNDIYLATLGVGLNQFTVQQKTDLTSIAQQCPLTGGTSVYQARVLLSIINDSITDYNDNCTGNSNRSMIIENNPTPIPIVNNSAFKLYPNPNNGDMILEYNLTENEKGVISIYDLTGRILKQYTINSKNTLFNINENELNSGIYYYSIHVNEKIVKTEKIVIIK
jgi:hypothetical protein